MAASLSRALPHRSTGLWRQKLRARVYRKASSLSRSSHGLNQNLEIRAREGGRERERERERERGSFMTAIPKGSLNHFTKLIGVYGFKVPVELRARARVRALASRVAKQASERCAAIWAAHYTAIRLFIQCLFNDQAAAERG